MGRKILMRGIQLEKELEKLSADKGSMRVLVKLHDGRTMYPNRAFGSYVDTDMSDQCLPDIALEVDDVDNGKTITVSDMRNSIAGVRKLEACEFDGLEVVIYFYCHEGEQDANGFPEEYPDEFPVEEIREVDGHIELVCNEFMNLWDNTPSDVTENQIDEENDEIPF